MNGKKAKKLRGIAQSLSVGMPSVEYTDINPGSKRFEYMDRNGKTRTFSVPTSTRVLIDTCTRKIYKNLKRLRPSSL